MNAIATKNEGGLAWENGLNISLNQVLVITIMDHQPLW